MPLSGRPWVAQFPTSTSIDDLLPPFLDNARNFVAALVAAQATVTIAATFRPPQRAYLMHYSFCVSREGLDPGAVPGMAGLDIQWLHRDPQGNPDLAASISAAREMVQAYGIAFRPALHSRHTDGWAIDMTISWQGNLTINSGKGTVNTIATLPRTGAANIGLHRVGASYGVLKLLTDPPHWSSDGH